VKELLKSSHICQSCWENESGTFLLNVVYEIIYRTVLYSIIKPQD